MDYAMKSLSFLSPRSLSRCVSAGSTSVTPKQWAMPAPHARPYRVSNWDRTLRKGIMAESLRDLLEKVHLSLPVVGTITLVLDEDGTMVETEEFFQTLQEGTVFLVLTKGQSWYPVQTAGYQLALSHKPHHRHDVACVTFDLYRTNPEDFIGCLNFKATLYGAYSISYDMRCYGAKRLIKEALRWTLLTMQATGHVLIGSSCYVQQLLDATEEGRKGGEDSPMALSKFCPLPARKMLQ
ncbi:PREDICTED: cell death activator CIDE-3-like [Gekko japonicus]|uniref:Cell death activator CIDE-3-like n=1 Tax=Gekko japonicus TaxID=146911 RepID=A0ABM1L499_GEKJA|nr:PREDICTED: cell death activator CIDE-3-like [Gekko japonicus]